MTEMREGVPTNEVTGRDWMEAMRFAGALAINMGKTVEFATRTRGRDGFRVVTVGWADPLGHDGVYEISDL